MTVAASENSVPPWKPASLARISTTTGLRPQTRIDHVLELFFIPVWTLKQGQPFRQCGRCGWDSRFARLDGPGAPAGAPRAPADWHGSGRHEEPTAPLLPELSCSVCGHGVKVSSRWGVGCRRGRRRLLLLI